MNEWILWGPPCVLLALPTLIFVRAAWTRSRIPLLTPSTTPTDCMVVIPARNEAALIGRAVASFPKDTVIVVDDGSTDATADEARRAGAGVIAVEKTPRGAFGKPHACYSGANVLTSDWILFADADTAFSPGFLNAAVAAALKAKLEFLSIHLTVDPHPVGPYAKALYYASLDPASVAAFRGQCVLARRESYHFLGGHGSLLRYFTEDTHLASSAQRHRMRFGVARAGAMGHAAFHRDGWIDGFRRQLFRALDAGPARLTWTLIGVTIAALWLPSAMWLWLVGFSVPALVALALPWVWLAPWYRDWRLAFAPIAIYVVFLIAWIGVFPLWAGKVPKWKGRTA